MLAIGPALATNPRLLREERLAAIIVEQHARKILPIIDRVLILERGRFLGVTGR